MSSGSSPPSDLAWKNFLFWTLGNPTQVRWFNSVWYKWKETFLIWWWREAVAYKKKTGSSNYWKDLAEVRYIGNMAFRLRKGRFEPVVLFSFFIGIFSNLDSEDLQITNYFTQLHVALGLGVEHGDAHAIVPLTRCWVNIIFWSDQNLRERVLSNQQQ